MRRGNTLEIPDMGHRSCQLDVAHALPAHAGLRDLHAAAVADNAFVTDLLIFAAVTLPVLGGSENPLAEQAVLLGLQRPVIDGFRLLYLASGPLSDLLRRSQTDLESHQTSWPDLMILSSLSLA